MPPRRPKIVQRGGFLEPLQRTPPFHYTTSASRQAWTRAVYPYAPYFFQMFQVIPWDSYRYEDDEVIVKCSSTPYSIFGGAANELYDREYGHKLPAAHRLHKSVDPTGDIDCRLSGLILKRKDGRHPTKDELLNMKDGHLRPWADHFSRWLLYYVYAYFTKLAYNFAAWYPDALPFELTDDAEAAAADISYVVGPFAIYRAVFREEDTYKLQVTMAVPFTGPEGQLGRKVDHMIEFLSWNPASPYEVYEDVDILPKLKLLIATVDRELVGNESGISDRKGLRNDVTYSHKYWNHVYRSMYLIRLMKHVPKPDIYSNAAAFHWHCCTLYGEIVKHVLDVGDVVTAKDMVDAADARICSAAEEFRDRLANLEGPWPKLKGGARTRRRSKK